MLTDKFVRSAAPGTYADGKGLYLRSYATGGKSWYARAQRNGKDVWLHLGGYPTVSLASARAKAVAALSGDVDVSLSVEAAWSRYYKHLAKEYRRPEQVERMFATEILPTLATTPLFKVTRTDITSVLQKIVDRGSPVMANRVLSQVKRFLDYCEQQGWISANPVASVKRRSIGGRESLRIVTLSEVEIREFLVTIRKMRRGTAWALYMCLATGKRASEVLSFSAVENGKLTGPGKTCPYVVAATPHIRALMKVKPVLPNDHRVLSRALARLGKRYTPHDLRRTFATQMADMGVMPHVVEKLLDHQMIGVMAVYNHAEYWPERVAAMRLWHKKLRALRRASTSPGDPSPSDAAPTGPSTG